MIFAFTVAAVCSAIDIDLGAEIGMSYPTGQWGNSLNTGVGSSDQGAASLTFFEPQLKAGYYLRPWGNIFNPGVVCAFGLCRSSLSNSGGTDPASWDPFWNVGLRWNFSIGGGFRGEAGGNYSNIMAEMETGDSFSLQLGISREVAL
jgi:hypothetical protein